MRILSFLFALMFTTSAFAALPVPLPPKRPANLTAKPYAGTWKPPAEIAPKSEKK